MRELVFGLSPFVFLSVTSDQYRARCSLLFKFSSAFIWQGLCLHGQVILELNWRALLSAALIEALSLVLTFAKEN